MSKLIFVHLRMTDVDRSTVFYGAVGARKESKFSNEHGVMRSRPAR